MLKRYLILFTVFLGVSTAFGHAGHSHKPVDEGKAKNVAKSVLEKLISSGKVDDSWKAKEPKLSQKSFGGESEWVATFQNPDLKDATKKTLYVFMSLSGEFLGANHTGN